MIVVIAVTEKQVIITDQFNEKPITGKMGIFQRVQAPTEMKADVEVVGVYSDLPNAESGRIAHSQHHPGRRYVQKVCKLDDIEPPVDMVIPKCIKCGTEVYNGQSFCARCNQIHLRECAALDTQPNAPNPIVRTTFGPALTPDAPPVLLNGGPT